MEKIAKRNENGKINEEYVKVAQEKFEREEELISKILEQCNQETYVENFNEDANLHDTRRTCVSHHVLPSGLHVYYTTVEVDTEGDYDFKHKNPFSNLKAGRVFIVPEEVSKDALKKNPRDLEMLVGDHAGIEYTFKESEDGKNIEGTISYGMGRFKEDSWHGTTNWMAGATIRRRSDSKSNIDYPEYFESKDYIDKNIIGYYREIKSDGINPEQSMIDLAKESVDLPKLSDEQKTRFVSELERLDSMLEKEREKIGTKEKKDEEVTTEKEEIESQQPSNPELNGEEKDVREDLINEILERISDLNLSKKEVERLTILLRELQEKENNKEQKDQEGQEL